MARRAFFQCCGIAGTPSQQLGLRSAIRAAVGILLLGSAAYGSTEEVDSASPWQGSMRVTASYSDNRDGVSSNKQGMLSMRGECSGGRRLRYGDRTEVRIAATPSIRWRDDSRHGEERSDESPVAYFGRLDLNMSHAISPMIAVTVGDSILYNDDGNVSSQGSLIRHDASYLNNSANLGTALMLDYESAAVLSAKADTMRYDDNALAAQLDSDTYTGEGLLSFSIGSGYTIAGRIGATRYDGVGRESDFGSTALAYGVAVEKVFVSEMTVKTLCSYQTMAFDDASTSQSSQFGGSAELMAPSSARTRWSAKAEYGFDLPDIGGYSGSKRKAALGSLDHEVLVDRWVMGVHGEVAESQYASEGEAAPAGTERSLKSGLSSNYKLDRAWSIRCAYSIEEWRSDLRDSFVRNVIDVGIYGAF